MSERTREGILLLVVRSSAFGLLKPATKMYRTTPLRGLWQHPPYFHDGSASDLPAVVNHYNILLSLGLTSAQKRVLVQFLKSL